MTTVDIPVVDEAYALARLDALMFEYGLPAYKHVWYRPDWTNGDANLRQLCPPTSTPPCCTSHSTPAPTSPCGDAFSSPGPRPSTIHEYDDGRWCAVWSEVIRVPGWLPGVKLSVAYSEDRWIDAPAGVR